MVLLFLSDCSLSPSVVLQNAKKARNYSYSFFCADAFISIKFLLWAMLAWKCQQSSDRKLSSWEPLEPKVPKVSVLRRFRALGAASAGHASPMGWRLATATWGCRAWRLGLVNLEESALSNSILLVSLVRVFKVWVWLCWCFCLWWTLAVAWWSRHFDLGLSLCSPTLVRSADRGALNPHTRMKWLRRVRLDHRRQRSLSKKAFAFIAALRGRGDLLGESEFTSVWAEWDRIRVCGG